MKKYWAAAPLPARAAHLLALVTVVYVGLALVATEIATAASGTFLATERDSAAYPAAGLVIVMVLVTAPLTLIGVLLALESASWRRAGAALCGLAGAAGILLALGALVPGSEEEAVTGLALMFWLPLAVIGAAYAAVAYAGFRDATRLAVRRAGGLHGLP